MLKDRLKYSRIKAGLTQKETANILGIGRTTVTQWEQGRNTPDLSTIAQLAGIYGVPVEYLLQLDSPNYPTEVDIIDLLNSSSILRYNGRNLTEVERADILKMLSVLIK